MGFKKGDTVECVEPYGGSLTEGKAYIVSSDEDGIFVEVRDDTFEIASWYPHRFKLFSTPAPAEAVKLFRKGDSVICVHNGTRGESALDASENLTKGRFYKVTKNQSASGNDLWVIDNHNVERGYYADRFEAFSAKPDVESLTIKQIRSTLDENDELKLQNDNLRNQVENLKNAVQQQAEHANDALSELESTKTALQRLRARIEQLRGL